VKLFQFEVNSSTASQYPYFIDLVFRKNIIELSDTQSNSFSELFPKKSRITNFTFYVF